MLAILGSGNVAKQIALQCIAMGIDIVFVNPDPESEQGELIGGRHVKVLRDYKKPYPFIVGVSKPKSKVDLIFQALYNNWEPAKSIAHRSAIICSPLGLGGFVGAYTSIGEAVIGDYVTIESHCTVKHDSQIGNYSTIHSGSRVIGSTVSGLVSIGYNCVLHGVRVAPEMYITHGTTLKRT